MVPWTKASWTLDSQELQGILDQEDRSLTFTELLKENSHRSFWPRPQGTLWKGDGEGYLALKGHSLLIPFLHENPKGTLPWIPNLKDRLAVFFSIIGPEEWVLRIQNHWGLTPYKTIHYHRMNLCEKPAPWDLPKDGEILPVGWENAPLVYPLQEAYEKEEVLFSSQEFHRPSSVLAFQKSLKTQKVLALFQNGQPKAKAHTNAQGFHWNQLGGIYTLPEYRGQGIGKAVVGALCNLCFLEKKRVTLFVKKQNLPAIGLYESLGFQIQENYRIAYFQR